MLITLCTLLTPDATCWHLQHEIFHFIWNNDFSSTDWKLSQWQHNSSAPDTLWVWSWRSAHSHSANLIQVSLTLNEINRALHSVLKLEHYNRSLTLSPSSFPDSICLGVRRGNCWNGICCPISHRLQWLQKLPNSISNPNEKQVADITRCHPAHCHRNEVHSQTLSIWRVLRNGASCFVGQIAVGDRSLYFGVFGSAQPLGRTVLFANCSVRLWARESLCIFSCAPSHSPIGSAVHSQQSDLRSPFPVRCHFGVHFVERLFVQLFVGDVSVSSHAPNVWHFIDGDALCQIVPVQSGFDFLCCRLFRVYILDTLFPVDAVLRFEIFRVQHRSQSPFYGLILCDDVLYRRSIHCAVKWHHSHWIPAVFPFIFKLVLSLWRHQCARCHSIDIALCTQSVWIIVGWTSAMGRFDGF